MRIFQMKTKPHSIDRFQQFMDENFICIGWPGLGDLENVSKDELRDRIVSYYTTSGHKLGYALGQVNAFVNTMQNGDIVVVSEKGSAYFGTVGNYSYHADYDNEVAGMCHQRTVQWLGRLPITELNASMQKLLSNRNTISEYPHSFEESGLEQMLSGTLPVNSPLNSKLDDLFTEALAVLENELNSDDADRRLKAAIEIARLKKG